MNKPHKHAEFIKAWADGAKIECCEFGYWTEIRNPQWYENREYRIKPKKKEPGQVYMETACGFTEENWSKTAQHSKEIYNKGALAVIKAYQLGEFNVCNCS